MTDAEREKDHGRNAGAAGELLHEFLAVGTDWPIAQRGQAARKPPSPPFDGGEGRGEEVPLRLESVLCIHDSPLGCLSVNSYLGGGQPCPHELETRGQGCPCSSLLPLHGPAWRSWTHQARPVRAER